MTAAIRHHPTEALLLDYATGAASDGVSLVMATHLTFCPRCRAEVAAAERIGGALVEQLEPVDIDPGARARILARLDEPEPTVEWAPVESAPSSSTTTPDLPQPLRARLGSRIDGLRWRALTSGVDQAMIRRLPGGGAIRLLRVRAGRSVPPHTHRGQEMICVLQGSFSDVSGTYGPGDVSLADETVDHAPTTAAGGDCVCLIVTEGPLRLTGWRALLNPFVRL